MFVLANFFFFFGIRKTMFALAAILRFLLQFYNTPEAAIFQWNKKPRKYGCFWRVCAGRHLAVHIRQSLQMLLPSNHEMYE
jgi:drug/metabolite transporter (DMT)-like permease